jgi:hypothetical protein
LEEAVLQGEMQQKLLLQGEMQQLRDKLAIAERTARSEAKLKVNRCNVQFELNF